MKIFLSHNKANKDIARALADALLLKGATIWFDEWSLHPGDSIPGGISLGLEDCNIFLLLWSSHSKQSHWVSTEINAFINRKVQNKELRVIPIMLDNTPLPILVAEYLGFQMNGIEDAEIISSRILGEQLNIELAHKLQKRLNELANSQDIRTKHLVCPKCASKELKRDFGPKEIFEKDVWFTNCLNENCDWADISIVKDQ